VWHPRKVIHDNVDHFMWFHVVMADLDPCAAHGDFRLKRQFKSEPHFATTEIGTGGRSS
jgi:hypothetical protein